MDKKLRSTQISFDTDDGVGTVVINEQVIKKITAIALNDIQGISMSKSNNSDGGIMDLFSKKKQSTKGVHAKIEGDSVKIAIDLVVEYGIGIPALTKAVQEKVKSSVENMTGLTVASVDIRVPDVNINQ